MCKEIMAAFRVREAEAIDHEGAPLHPFNFLVLRGHQQITRPKQELYDTGAYSLTSGDSTIAEVRLLSDSPAAWGLRS